VVGEPAILGRKREFHLPVLHHDLELSEHAFAVLFLAESQHALHLRICSERPRGKPDVGPTTHELTAEGGYINVRGTAAEQIGSGFGFCLDLDHVHP